MATVSIWNSELFETMSNLSNEYNNHIILILMKWERDKWEIEKDRLENIWNKKEIDQYCSKYTYFKLLV